MSFDKQANLDANLEYCEDSIETLKILQSQTQIPLKNVDVSEMYEACEFDERFREYAKDSKEPEEDWYEPPINYLIDRALKSKNLKEIAASTLNPDLYRHTLKFRVDKKLNEIYKELDVEQYVRDKNLIKTLPIEQQKEIALKLCSWVVDNTEYDFSRMIRQLPKEQQKDFALKLRGIVKNAEAIFDHQNFSEYSGIEDKTGLYELESLHLVLSKGRGICNDFAKTLSKMLDDVGIANKCLHLTKSFDSNTSHLVCVMSINNQKFILDPVYPTYEMVMLQKNTKGAPVVYSLEDYAKQKHIDKYIFSEDDVKQALSEINPEVNYSELSPVQIAMELDSEKNNSLRLAYTNESLSNLQSFYRLHHAEQLAENSANFEQQYMLYLAKNTQQPVEFDSSVSQGDHQYEHSLKSSSYFKVQRSLENSPLQNPQSRKVHKKLSL